MPHPFATLLGRQLRGPLRECWIELAGLFPTEHVERFHEFADAVGLSAHQPEFY